MRSDSTFALVLDTALDAVIVMGSDGHVVEWNPQAEELFGWSRAEVIGAEMAGFIIPERYRNPHHDGLQRYLASGEGPVLRKRIEITALHKSGEEFPVELSISPAQRDGETIFIGFIRDIRAKAHQAILVGELEHRTKNMLAVVMGLVRQTAKQAATVEDFTREYLSRLTSLSRAYGLLTAKSWQSATLKGLVSEVVAPHLARPEQLNIEGEDILFPAKTALSVSMVLHELTTNAVKYGALKHNGVIRITTFYRVEGGREMIDLTWSEEGVPGFAKPASSGFGSKLIETTIKHELGGATQIEYSALGIRYRFSFPAPTEAGSTPPQ